MSPKAEPGALACEPGALESEELAGEDEDACALLPNRNNLPRKLVSSPRTGPGLTARTRTPCAIKAPIVFETYRASPTSLPVRLGQLRAFPGAP